MAVKPIPGGMHTITPYLACKDAKAAMKFYEKAFGAQSLMCLESPDGKVMHGRIQIGDSRLFLMDEAPQMGFAAPSGSTTVSIHIMVPNVDEFFKHAVDNGATSIMPPMDMFWGDRYGSLADPYGHRWSVATHLKDMTEAEMVEAAKEAFAQMGEGSCADAARQASHA